MPLSVVNGVEQNFGDSGSSYDSRTAVTVGINTSVAVPQGWQLVETDAHTTVRFTPDSGTTFITLVAISSAAIVWSDGFTTEFRGDVTGGTAHRSHLRGT